MKKIILLTSFLFYLQLSFSQSGEWDPSFGKGGSVRTNFVSLPGLTRYRSVAIQPDGKIVAAGYNVSTLCNNSKNKATVARQAISYCLCLLNQLNLKF